MRDTLSAAVQTEVVSARAEKGALEREDSTEAEPVEAVEGAGDHEGSG